MMMMMMPDQVYDQCKESSETVDHGTVCRYVLNTALREDSSLRPRDSSVAQQPSKNCLVDYVC